MTGEEIIESIAKDQKSTQPSAFGPNCFRDETNIKWAKVSPPVLQKYGYVTSWLYKRDSPLIENTLSHKKVRLSYLI